MSLKAPALFEIVRNLYVVLCWENCTKMLKTKQNVCFIGNDKFGNLVMHVDKSHYYVLLALKIRSAIINDGPL